VSEPVRVRVRGKREEVMEKPSVILNYVENMDGVDNADRYMTTYCFL
jgi:hypothetical protein